MRRAVSRVGREALKMLPAAGFFAAAFSLIVLDERVALRGSALEVTTIFADGGLMQCSPGL